MNTRSTERNAGEDPPCRECRHFFITHEPAHPWGCRAFGIAAARLPALVVRESSGEPCGAFEPRPAARR